MEKKRRTAPSPGRSGKIVTIWALSATVAAAGAVLGIHLLFLQWQEVDAHRELAEELLIQSLGEINSSFVARVAESNGREMETSAGLINSLLRTAKYYAAFAEKAKSKPRLRLSRARALYQSGRAYLQAGFPLKAEEAYRAARDAYAELADDDANYSIIAEAAACSNSLCHVLAMSGKRDEALSLAEGIAASLRLPDPSSAHWEAIAEELAVAKHNLGVLKMDSLRLDEALPLFQQAALLRGQIAERSPKGVSALERAIDAHQYWARALWQSKRFAEAAEINDRSQRWLDRLWARRSELGLRNLGMRLARESIEMNRKSSATVAASDRLKPRPGWRWRSIAEPDGKSLPYDLNLAGTIPAEFENHEGLLLSFCWNMPDEAQRVTIEIIAAVQGRIRVVVMVPDDRATSLLMELLRNAKVPTDRILLLHIPTNTVWVRDYGPFTIRTADGDYRFVDTGYAYNRPADDRVPSKLARLANAEEIPTYLNLTGGNVLSNGKGLLLVTSHVLKVNAKLGLSESFVRQTLRRLFGAQQIVFLDPLQGERTGDVDMFALFTAPDTIVVGDYEGRDPVNDMILARNVARLKEVRVDGKALRVERIPMPPRGADNFVGTFTNVIFANGVLALPSWPDCPPEIEKRAFAVLQRLLPGWRIVPVNAGPLRGSSGALRCMSLQLPIMPSFAAAPATAPSDTRSDLLSSGADKAAPLATRLD